MGVFDYMRNLANQGTDKDEIPEGTGRFGYDVTNPIPTHMIEGSESYLNRLYMSDEGDGFEFEFEWERMGSTLAPNIKNPIDVYEILIKMDENPMETITLYINPYHKKTSTKAPDGFKLLPEEFNSILNQ